MNTNDPYDVFLSYARGDSRGLVDDIASCLVARKLRVFVDHRQLAPDEKVPPAELQDALDRSRVVVLLVSEHYAERPYCCFEAARAVDGALRLRCDVLPVRTVEGARLPPFLGSAAPPGRDLAGWVAQAVKDRLALREGGLRATENLRLTPWFAWADGRWSPRGVEVAVPGDAHATMEASLQIGSRWMELGLPRISWRLEAAEDLTAAARWRERLPWGLKPVIAVRGGDARRGDVLGLRGDLDWDVELIAMRAGSEAAGEESVRRYGADELFQGIDVDLNQRLRRLLGSARSVLLDNVLDEATAERVAALRSDVGPVLLQGPGLPGLSDVLTTLTGRLPWT